MRDRATAYAERVVSGDVVAGELHVQACRRHLRDLERQGTDEFPYLWVPEKSEEILDFAETLTIVEGDGPRPVPPLRLPDLRPGRAHGMGQPQGLPPIPPQVQVGGPAERQDLRERHHRHLPGRLRRLPLRQALHRGHQETPGPAGLGGRGAVCPGGRRPDGVLPHPGLQVPDHLLGDRLHH